MAPDRVDEGNFRLPDCIMMKETAVRDDVGGQIGYRIVQSVVALDQIGRYISGYQPWMVRWI